MQEIVFPEDVRKMLWIIIGEMPLQARENLAYYSKDLYLNFGRGVRSLRDEIQTSIVDAATSLPDDVGDAYVRGLSLLVDDGGVNHLDGMIDQLEEIAQGQVNHSIKIQAAKWEIIAEIVMLLIELALLAALAAITGGTSISQMALARARSRLAVFMIVQRLVQLAPFTAVLTEAFEEALQSLAVQLAQIALNPGGRKPKGIDWRDVGKSAAAGALNGLFEMFFRGGGKVVKNWFKNLDSFDKFARTNPNWAKGLNGGAVLTGEFVSSAVSESMAEYLVQGAFEGEWDFKWETFVGAGTSSVITVIAGGALVLGGLKVNKFLTTTEFDGVNDSTSPPGDTGNGGGRTGPPPTTSADPVSVPSPLPTVTSGLPPHIPAPPVTAPVPPPVTSTGNVPVTPPPLPPSLPVPTPSGITDGVHDGGSDVSSLDDVSLFDDDSLFDSDTASLSSATTYASTSSSTPPGADPAALSGSTAAKGLGGSGSRTGLDDVTDRTADHTFDDTADDTFDDSAADLDGTDGGPNTTTSPAAVSTPETHTPRTGTGTGAGAGTGTGTGTGAAANSASGGPRSVSGDTGRTEVRTTDTSGDLFGEDSDESAPRSSTGHPTDTDTDATLPHGSGTGTGTGTGSGTSSGSGIGSGSGPASGAEGSDGRRVLDPEQEQGGTQGEFGDETAEVPPVTTAHPVPAAPASSTGGSAFEAARAAASPVTRTHTWVDPVSTPADPARPGGTTQYVVHSKFEARRFVFDGESVVDLTVQVAAPDGMPAPVWDKVRAGVEAHFNAAGHRLPDGDLLHVTVELVSGDSHPHALDVSLVGRDQQMTRNAWWADAEPVDYAHEIAHQLGLRDESRGGDPAAAARPDIPGSLMGDFTRPAPDGLAQGGLRGRHLALLGALVGDLTTPSPESRSAVPAPQRPVPTTSGPWGAESRAPRAPQPTSTVTEDTGTTVADTGDTPALTPAVPLTTVSGPESTGTAEGGDAVQPTREATPVPTSVTAPGPVSKTVSQPESESESETESETESTVSRTADTGVVHGAPSGRFTPDVMAAFYRAYADHFFSAERTASDFDSVYYDFVDGQNAVTRELAVHARTVRGMERFHAELLGVEEERAAMPTPIDRQPGDPMRLYRKMSTAEAQQILVASPSAGLNAAMAYNQSAEYRKFFTTSLSHTSVFSNANAASDEEVVVEFTLAWDPYWDFMGRFGTPNQQAGAYQVRDSALVHQERLRTGAAANFRTAQDVEAVHTGHTHHNIGIGHGNARDFGRLVTTTRQVGAQEVEQAARTAADTARADGRRTAHALIQRKLDQLAGVQGEPFGLDVLDEAEIGVPSEVEVVVPEVVEPADAEGLLAGLSGLSVAELLVAVGLLPVGVRRWLAGRAGFVAGVRSRLSVGEFAEFGARLLVVVPGGSVRPVSARWEAGAQVARMFRDGEVVSRLLGSGAVVVVLPQDVALGSVGSFVGLGGVGGRGLDELRGAQSGLVAVIAEENLLGERTSVGGVPSQAEGYSSATHEVAHLIHTVGLTDMERELIRRVYDAKRAAGHDVAWPDGVRRDLWGQDADNYSSTDVFEFFAQLSNAYVGTNHGVDAVTGRARNNGAAWVRENEPELVPLLERLYGVDPEAVHSAPANPVAATAADNATYEAFLDFMTGIGEAGPAVHASVVADDPGRRSGSDGSDGSDGFDESGGAAPQSADAVVHGAPPARHVTAAVMGNFYRAYARFFETDDAAADFTSGYYVFAYEQGVLLPDLALKQRMMQQMAGFHDELVRIRAGQAASARPITHRTGDPMRLYRKMSVLEAQEFEGRTAAAGLRAAMAYNQSGQYRKFFTTSLSHTSVFSNANAASDDEVVVEFTLPWRDYWRFVTTYGEPNQASGAYQIPTSALVHQERLRTGAAANFHTQADVDEVIDGHTHHNIGIGHGNSREFGRMLGEIRLVDPDEVTQAVLDAEASAADARVPWINAEIDRRVERMRQREQAALHGAPPGATPASITPGTTTPDTATAPSDATPDTAPAPIRPDQWRDRRAQAPASPLYTEWFDPAADPLSERRAPGTLHGRTTLIRMHVRRIQADDGRWVRNLSLHLPVRFGKGFTAEDLPAFQERLRGLLDTHLNHGLNLPRSGDQLHVDLLLTPAPEHAEAIELSRDADPGRSDQLHLRLGADPARDDAVALHEIAHYTGMRDRGRDGDSLFRRLLRTVGTGVMADTTRLPGEGAFTSDDLRTVENVLDAGPAVPDHAHAPTSPAPRDTSPAGEPLPTEDPLPPDTHDGRWDVSQAPRDWSTPLSSYVSDYGSQYDGHVGLVHVEPLPASVVDGVHRQILDALGITGTVPDHHPVLLHLRATLTADELARQLPYLRSSTGARFTVRHDGRDRTVDIRLALREPTRSERYGAHSTEDPEKRVERRAQGGQESSHTAASGTVRTIPVNWSGRYPVTAAGPVSAVDGALALTLTHNEYASVTTVTHVVQTMTAQRSNELSRPIEFGTVWQVRVDAPGQPPAGGWSDARTHGPVTVWFPEHLAVDNAEQLPAPADLDDLPVWGVDSVREPARLLAEVRRGFATDLADLSDTSAQELETFLSEPVLRGTLPLQRGRGLYSPLLLDSDGRVIGMLKVTTEVTPGAPTHRSLDGKINLEAHVAHTVKIDSSAKFTSGAALDGSVGPSFTGDRAQGHPDAATKAAGSFAVKGGVKGQTSATLSASGSATMAHAVRSNRGHLLTPARVTHHVTLIRARGGSTARTFGPWDDGMRLRVLAAEQAEGTEHRPGQGDRQLPEELENLRTLGASTAPLVVDGTEQMFERAEAWLRAEGFLPPLEAHFGLFDEARAQAQLANLRRFEQARSEIGLRAAADAMVDGGHPEWFDLPDRTGGVRRVQLRLSAFRDTAPGPATDARHRRTLPDIQVMGISSFAAGGGESSGYAYGAQGGFGGGPSGPLGSTTPWTLGGTGDYLYSGQTAHTATAGSAVNQDQFFIGSGQSTEIFDVPARFALDLYESQGTDPAVRFADPASHPDAHPTRPADVERPAPPETPPPATVSGHLTLAVPRNRTVPAGTPRRAPATHRVRPVDATDRRRLALTGPDGTPVDGVVRLPDDAVMDVLPGTAALLDAFEQIVTHTYPGRPEKGLLETVQEAAAAKAPAVAKAVGKAVGKAAETLTGSDATDQGTPFMEALRSALGPANRLGRAHQIFKGGYVIEGLTLPGLGADHEFSVELQGYLHDAEHLHSGKQYLETDVGATDTTQQQVTSSGGHQVAVTATSLQRPRKTPEGAKKPEPTGAFNPSGRHAYSSRTDRTHTQASSTGVTRTPTESGTLHRVGSRATVLITVRHGRRNLVGNTLGLTGAAPVTVAVDLPPGTQFLLSDAQLARDAAWFTGVDGLTVPTPLEATLPLPDRFARTRAPGLAGILSAKQYADDGTERRDRLRAELTALVEREAPGATVPGHPSFLPGVLARIADMTSPTALRALPGRGPHGARSFHFRHVTKGGARLVEVTLAARPVQDTAGLRTVRGRPAGGGSGFEQVHVHAPANTSSAVTHNRRHVTTGTPTARYPRPTDDTRTDRTGPAFSSTVQRADTSRTATSGEDRFWMRTDNAADFDVDYAYTASVRSELVTDWPLDVPGGIIEAGVLAWYDEDITFLTWLERMLRGRPAATATVPVRVTLRFTGSEATDPAAPVTPVPAAVSAVHPLRTSRTGSGGPHLADGQRLVPTGPTPVFHYHAYAELAQALTTVAPRLAATWGATKLSESAEAAAVRIGELVQAGEISLDPPRAAGLTQTLPGAYPDVFESDDPPGLRIELFNPRRVTDAGDVALDRLRLPTITANTAQTAGSASATVLQTAYAADDRDLLGAGLPLLAQQPVSRGEGSGITATRREWFKGGGTALPENGRGTRTYETLVDTVITVNGPEGTVYVTGSAEMRLGERDVLGYGITDARTDPQVYDLRSLLAALPQADLRDWTTHPLGDLPRALADGLDPGDPAAQLWLAIGPDPDGSLLARALYAASRTAALAGRPVELVLRTDEGLRHWRFSPTGDLDSTDAGTLDAWTGLSAQITAHADALRAQDEARDREAALRGPQARGATALATAEDDLTTAETAQRTATDAVTRTGAEVTTAETRRDTVTAERDRWREETRRLTALLLEIPHRISEATTEATAAAGVVRATQLVLTHIARQKAGTVPENRIREARDRAARAEARRDAARDRLDALRAEQKRLQGEADTARTTAEKAAGRLPALEKALSDAETAAAEAATLLTKADDRLDQARTDRDARRTDLRALNRSVVEALKEQSEQAAAQSAAHGRLPGLAQDVDALRRGTDEGLVSVPLSSLATTPAARPGPRNTLRPSPAVPQPQPQPAPVTSDGTTQKAQVSGTSETVTAKPALTEPTSTEPASTKPVSTSTKPASTKPVSTSTKPASTEPAPQVPKVTPPKGKGKASGSTSGSEGQTKKADPSTTPAPPTGGPARGRLLRTVANGECLLYAVIGSAPRLVRDALPGLATTHPDLHRWLSATDGVRGALAHRAKVFSHTGTMPPHPNAEAAAAALRALVAGYLDQAVADETLPYEVIGQLRQSTVREFAQHLHDPGTARTDLLNLARWHGVGTPEALAGLTDDDLRTRVLAAYPTSTARPTSEELAPLLAAVENWSTHWSTPYGETFLALTAHALGVTFDVARSFTDAPDLVVSQHGPHAPGTPRVEVYYSPTSSHYSASDADKDPSGGSGAGVVHGAPSGRFTPEVMAAFYQAYADFLFGSGAAASDFDSVFYAFVDEQEVVTPRLATDERLRPQMVRFHDELLGLRAERAARATRIAHEPDEPMALYRKMSAAEAQQFLSARDVKSGFRSAMAYNQSAEYRKFFTTSLSHTSVFSNANAASDEEVVVEFTVPWRDYWGFVDTYGVPNQTAGAYQIRDSALVHQERLRVGAGANFRAQEDVTEVIDEETHHNIGIGHGNAPAFARLVTGLRVVSTAEVRAAARAAARDARQELRYLASELITRKLEAARNRSHGEPFGPEALYDTEIGVPSEVEVVVPEVVEPADAEGLLAGLSGLSVAELLVAVGLLPVGVRRWLAGRGGFVGGVRSRLSVGEFAEFGARLLVVVPGGSVRPVSARWEAGAQVARMFRDGEVVSRLLGSGAVVVVLPQDVALGSVGSFVGLGGVGGRGLDELRGAQSGLVAVIAEENLLGERTSVGGVPSQAEGYSSATHEVAHLIHTVGLTDSERELVDRVYKAKRDAGADEEWPDGVRRDVSGREADNYSSTDVFEFFAQLSNAYVGTNHGVDAVTGRARNNGAAWVRENEPELVPLLERLYGVDPEAVHSAPANPVAATAADNATYEAFLDFMTGIGEAGPAVHASVVADDPGRRSGSDGSDGSDGFDESDGSDGLDESGGAAHQSADAVVHGAPPARQVTAAVMEDFYRAYARFFETDDAAADFTSGYYVFAYDQDVVVSKLALHHSMTGRMAAFHDELVRIRALQAASAKPILRDPGDPMQLYRKMSVLEAEQFQGRNPAAGLRAAMAYNQSAEYRKFFTTSLSHTSVFSNANAASDEEVVVEFTLPWRDYWRFVTTYGEPNQASGAYQIPTSALVHQERLRTGAAANFRSASDVQDVIDGQTHHNIGIGHGNARDFGKLLTGIRLVGPDEVNQAAWDAEDAAGRARVPLIDAAIEARVAPLRRREQAALHAAPPGTTAPSPAATTEAGAVGTLIMPKALDRRELAKQAISRPLPGTRHRQPLTVHATQHAAESGQGDRHMVPDAQDVELLHALRTPGDPRHRAGWEDLTPSQTWALLAAEQRGELFHARDREAFLQRVTHFNSTFRTRYPVDDAERMAGILQDAHDHVRRLPIASNIDLASRPPGTAPRPDGTVPTRAEALTSDTGFRNFWESGTTGGTASRAGRGWVEELQGYAAALRRVDGTPQDGPGSGAFDPPSPEELPKYAALVSPAQKGGTYSYGSAVVHWKEPVRGRVTHTPGDSADTAERGVLSYTDNAHVYPLLAYGEERRVRLALAEATRFRYDPEMRRDVAELGYAAVGRYFESQIHGDLSWTDVDRIVLNWGDLFGSAQRFTTRAEAESMAAFLRAVATDRNLGFAVELGREIGSPGGAERAADQRITRLYDPEDGVGDEERELSAVLDRLASPAPFLARADDQALVALARSAGIVAQDQDQDQALSLLWQAAQRARALLPPGTELTREHLAAGTDRTPDAVASDAAASGPVPQEPTVHQGADDPARPSAEGLPFAEALVSALGETATPLRTDRGRTVPVADLAGLGVTLTGGQTAQAVLLGGALTIDDLGLTQEQHLRWLLRQTAALDDLASDRTSGVLVANEVGEATGAEGAWAREVAVAAAVLGVRIVVVTPDGRAHTFGSDRHGTVRLLLDGTRYVVAEEH